MGRYGGEIAVVGVKTRARAALTMASKNSSSSPSKKIKKASKASSFNTNNNNCNYQLRSGNRRRNSSRPENFDSQIDCTAMTVVEVVVEEEKVANCSSSEVITTTVTTNSDFPPSCCSSNEKDENNDQSSSSNDVVMDRVADPEVKKNGEASSRYVDCNTTTEEKEEASLREEDAAKANGQDCSDRKSTVQIKMMPSDAEIEAFFNAAEKDHHKRFIDKYNFDFVKEMPLEGRYEWVQIKP